MGAIARLTGYGLTRYKYTITGLEKAGTLLPEGAGASVSGEWVYTLTETGIYQNGLNMNEEYLSYTDEDTDGTLIFQNANVTNVDVETQKNWTNLAEADRPEKVELTLYHKVSYEDASVHAVRVGEDYYDPVTEDAAGEAIVNPVFVTADDHWYHKWTGLAHGTESYYVGETAYYFDGNRHTDVSDTFTVTSQPVSADSQVDGLVTTSITNEARPVPTTDLTVKKEWYDSSGNLIPDNQRAEEAYQRTVTLYRMTGLTNVEPDSSGTDYATITAQGSTKPFTWDPNSVLAFTPGDTLEITVAYTSGENLTYSVMGVPVTGDWPTYVGSTTVDPVTGVSTKFESNKC